MIYQGYTGDWSLISYKRVSKGVSIIHCWVCNMLQIFLCNLQHHFSQELITVFISGLWRLLRSNIYASDHFIFTVLGWIVWPMKVSAVTFLNKVFFFLSNYIVRNAFNVLTGDGLTTSPCSVATNHQRFADYRIVPKFSDRQFWANSADPDQTAPRGAVWSGSTLFAIPSTSFGCITLKETPSCSTFRVITTNVLGVRIFRKFTVVTDR